MITDLSGGYLYRNPKPHVRSIHAYFPCAALLPDASVHLVFWAVEDGVGAARWLKFRVQS